MSWPGLTRPSSLKIQKDGICHPGWPPRRAAMTIRGIPNNFDTLRGSDCAKPLFIAATAYSRLKGGYDKSAQSRIQGDRNPSRTQDDGNLVGAPAKLRLSIARGLKIDAKPAPQHLARQSEGSVLVRR